MPRKTTGCWTCRARKKKCDDTRPSCSACTHRSITCYGYDEKKPEWMDGDQLERDFLLRLQRQVKDSYRHRRSRKARARPRSTHLSRVIEDSEISSTPCEDEGSPLRLGSSSPRRAREVPVFPFPSPRFNFGFSNRGTSRASSLSTVADYHQPNPHTASDPSPDPVAVTDAETYAIHSEPDNQIFVSPGNGSGVRYSYTEDEINLLMYYLDHIFPRLSPYFHYTAGDAGRGWLLNLLLRTKPLCTAVACLSACDQAQFVLGPLSDIPQPYHELEMQHLRSVSDLRDHLDQLSKKTGARQIAASVEALACIMHLILFELWIPRRGIMSDWRMHLDAASALISSVDAATTEGSRSPSVSDMLETSDRQLEESVICDIPIELLSDGERAAFEWFLALYTYCLIISAASLGLTPKTAEAIPRTRAIFHRGQTKLRDGLGGADWVMLTYLDIALLREWKQKMTQSGTLSLRELARRADEIEERLNEGLSTLAASEPSTALSYGERQKRMVTNVHINGALVLLHVVVSGFYPNILEIRKAVMQTLNALEYMREHSDVYFPSFPYCVAGCLALESDYQRFRDLVPPPKKESHPPVLAKWTLEILEECWKTRKSQAEGEEVCSWVTAMKNIEFSLLFA